MKTEQSAGQQALREAAQVMDELADFLRKVHEQNKLGGAGADSELLSVSSALRCLAQHCCFSPTNQFHMPLAVIH